MGQSLPDTEFRGWDGDMKRALAAASLVLLVGTGAGCGDDGDGGGAPSDASVDDFCGTFNDFYAEAEELGEDAADEDLVAALKNTGEELGEVGTPEDISDDARAGFEATVEAIEDLPDDATQEDVANLEDDYSEKVQGQVDEFASYLNETCGFDEGGGEAP